MINSLVLFKCVTNEWVVPICSNLGNRVNCRMPQSERNRRVAFRWEQVMEAVLRMTNLFEAIRPHIIRTENFVKLACIILEITRGTARMAGRFVCYLTASLYLQYYYRLKPSGITLRKCSCPLLRYESGRVVSYSTLRLPPRPVMSCKHMWL